VRIDHLSSGRGVPIDRGFEGAAHPEKDRGFEILAKEKSIVALDEGPSKQKAIAVTEYEKDRFQYELTCSSLYTISLTLRPSTILANKKTDVDFEVAVYDSSCSPVQGAFVKLFLDSTKVALGSTTGIPGGGYLQTIELTDKDGRATIRLPVTGSTGQYDNNPISVMAVVSKDFKELGKAHGTLMINL
jgi:hypothetical protein